MPPTAVGGLARTPAQHARRDRIVEAALELLADREYERIQIRQVAEHAGVALATLYRYFPSKEQLYAHALLAWSGEFGAATSRRTPALADDRERLRAALRRAARAYERFPNIYRLLIVLEAVSDPVVADLFSTFAGRFGTALRATVHDHDEHDAETLAYVSSAVLGSLLRSWSRGATSMADVYTEIDRVVDLVFAGPRLRTTAPSATEAT